MQAAKMKACSRCAKKKSTKDFFRNRAAKDGYKSLCKVCEIKGKTQFPSKEDSKDRGLRHKYGITLDEYNIILAGQEHRCKICGVHEDHCDRALAVDHDHITSAVRGLLCMGCNTGLGLFRDNPKFLQEAINYLNTERGN